MLERNTEKIFGQSAKGNLSNAMNKLSGTNWTQANMAWNDSVGPFSDWTEPVLHQINLKLTAHHSVLSLPEGTKPSLSKRTQTQHFTARNFSLGNKNQVACSKSLHGKLERKDTDIARTVQTKIYDLITVLFSLQESQLKSLIPNWPLPFHSTQRNPRECSVLAISRLIAYSCWKSCTMGWFILLAQCSTSNSRQDFFLDTFLEPSDFRKEQTTVKASKQNFAEAVPCVLTEGDISSHEDVPFHLNAKCLLVEEKGPLDHSFYPNGFQNIYLLPEA